MSSDSRTLKPIIPFLEPLTRVVSVRGAPLLRFATGLVVAPHGAQKLFGWFGGDGLEATAQIFSTKMGLPPQMALIAGLVELLGGLGLAFGFLTRLSAAGVCGAMLVAVCVLRFQFGKGYFSQFGGFEYPLFLAIVAFSFVLAGGGRCSVDSLLGREI